jgi:hypothetical protein
VGETGKRQDRLLGFVPGGNMERAPRFTRSARDDDLLMKYPGISSEAGGSRMLWICDLSLDLTAVAQKQNVC